eukprot:gene33426-42887_t
MPIAASNLVCGLDHSPTDGEYTQVLIVVSLAYQDGMALVQYSCHGVYTEALLAQSVRGLE